MFLMMKTRNNILIVCRITDGDKINIDQYEYTAERKGDI